MDTKYLRKIISSTLNGLAIFVLVFSVTGSVYAQEYNPWFTVFPEQGVVEGWDWPLGEEILLTIDDPDTPDKSPDYSQTEIVIWKYENNWVWIDFANWYSIKPGDEITVSLPNGEMAQTHVVQNLTITGIDPSENIVSGTANEEQVVVLWSWEDLEGRRIETDGSGTWSVDFDDIGFDLEPGYHVRAEVWAGNNDTAVDWEVPESPPIPWREEFDGPELNDDWYWVGNINTDNWALVGGNLRIDASTLGTGGENLLQRSIAAGDFSIETRVSFAPDANFQFAGLVIWQDEGNFLQLGRAFCDIEGPCVGNGIYFDYIGDGGFVDGNFATQVDNPFEPNAAFLRLERRGEMVRAFYSHEGITWIEIGTHWIPPDFQVNGVGLTNSNNQSSVSSNSAYFDYFELTEGWGFLPEGFHDYDQGDVPDWACNVGGWAADPDNRTTDLAIEVSIDGTSLSDWLYASEYREDLESAEVCEDGYCSFSTSLWGTVSSYDPHSVVVFAQDIPSGEWVQLSSSPKELTCRSYDIYAFDPVTDQIKLITSNLPDTGEYDPTWSQNGNLIAHDVVSGDTHGIYITDVRTGVSTPLIGAQDGGNDASWSPNGQWIAFDRRWYGGPNIYVVPAAGGTESLIRENAVSANWSPNGRRIIFQDDTDGSIRTVPFGGGRGEETFVVDYGELPAWSPDGNWIAYTRDGDIWKVPVNIHGEIQGEPIQLTSGPFSDGKPTWSADSQTIFYDSGLGQDWDLWSIPAAGGTPTWLNGAPVFGEYGAANVRNSSAVAYASFSPNGQAPRLWVAAYTYDPQPGMFGVGSHPYHFEFEWSSPDYGSWSGQGGEIEVSYDAELQDGYVLLRGEWELRGINTSDGLSCDVVPEITPDQLTRFLVGWLPDYGEIHYSDAKAHFESITAMAVWDESMSAELEPHMIVPFTLDDWFQYVCTFTDPSPKMDLRVNYGDDWVESFYEAGHEVVVTVTEGDGETVKATATVWTEPKDFWGWEEGFQTGWSDWVDGDGQPMESPPDIQPWDWVYAQVDSGVRSKMQIGEISGTINLETNSVEGTVYAPWFSDEVGIDCHSWGAPLPEEIIKNDWVLPDGTDTYACAWDPEFEWDIQPGEIVGVGYSGQDGHWVANVIANPQILAFPEANQIFGYGWPTGSDVSLAINGGGTLISVKVQGAPWDENDIMAFFDIGELHDLVTDDLILLSGSGMDREHTVQHLTVTEVDWEVGTVTGQAENGVEVHSWVHGFGQDVWLPVSDGTWMANFGSDDFHLQPGMCGRAEIRGEGYNSTNVDWCVPLPSFAAYMPSAIEGYDWPMGDEISLTINDGVPINVISEQRPGFPEGETRVLFEELSLEVGDHVVMTDLETGFFKELWVADLQVTEFNLSEKTVSGIYDPARSFWIQLDGQDPMEITYFSNTWVATFAEMSPGTLGYIAQDDYDHDGTVWEFLVPNE